MKKNRYEVKTQNTMLYIMLGSMTVLCLYLSYIIPVVGFLFYILSSFFVMGVLADEKPLAAVILFLVVSGVTLIILPIPRALPYIMFFGHYGIAKYFFDKIRDKLIRPIAKFLYFNAFCALIYFLTIATGYIDLGELISLPIWAIILILQPCFFVYDLLLGLFLKTYEDVWEKRLMQ